MEPDSVEAASGRTQETHVLRSRVHVLRDAIHETGVVALGYLPLGIALGVFAASQGIPVWLVTLMSAVIYAGSMEFTAVTLMTSGVALPQVAITTFFVNFRHIFYGLSFPLHKVRSVAGKLYSVHALTDEAYALVVARDTDSLDGAHLVAIQFLCQFYWVIGATVGAVVGALLPFDTSFMGFSLTALFVSLTVDELKRNRMFGQALAAFICGVMALIIVPEQMLMVALGCYTAISVWRVMRELHDGSQRGGSES
ncbi:MAG: AzlC family ABC transporter permease [Actinomycetaceae bacterium]|nr:AzlC family ABC transporter permease [Actinomycetaceae bacterium]MDY6083588.1 AzlC family ABC transporter permease [Actinomycetaceae bacterium]